tara:strand:- start:251 stop:430 length:180 start_codon:yes stop_codon:yes gene_type:complete
MSDSIMNDCTSSEKMGCSSKGKKSDLKHKDEIAVRQQARDKLEDMAMLKSLGLTESDMV